MYYDYWPYSYPYRSYSPMYPYPPVQPTYQDYPYWNYHPMYNHYEQKRLIHIKDYGPAPIAINIEDATKQNTAFRQALWTGKHLQVTLMSINVGEDIGLERHPNLDQFIRIEEGHGLIMMGDKKDRLDFQQQVHDDFAIIIPAGKWHNLINTGHTPLKLYSIYAPPQHPHGTVHQTKADAIAAEKHHG
jgi:mannose-6-phosphate isomerase-like protein (cupin superfamily)